MTAPQTANSSAAQASTRAPSGADSPNPAPHRGRGDTIATDTVLAALGQAPGANAADLAYDTGLGRSTVTKALATLADREQVDRIPGGRDQTGRRMPDRWVLAGQPDPASVRALAGPASGETEEEPAGSDAHPKTGPGADTEDSPGGPIEQGQDADTEARDPVPDDPDAEEGEHVNSATEAVSSVQVAQASSHDADGETEVPALADEGVTDDTRGVAPPPDMHPRDAGAGTEPSEQAPEPDGRQGSRLGRGKLRAKVLDHLHAYPGEEFTPFEISKAVGHSAGAIANALAKLTDTGDVVVTSDKPRRYQLAQEAISQS